MAAERATLTEAELIELGITEADRQPCEVWTRVMGYHRPVTSFNRGKQGEYEERVCFDEPGELAN
jgi:hypothetical protein